tara:strand:- start:57 stop:239 length:183 start_codon:yes stop_codon:yes gene_type:complete
MDGMNYLSFAYLGMIAAIAVWTWTIVSRSRSIEERLAAVEASIGIDSDDADELAKLSDDA